MFLNSLKVKSIRRKIEKLVKSRDYEAARKGSLANFAIIQNHSTPFDEKFIEILANNLGVKTKDVTILEYTEELTKENKEKEKLFSDGDIGWNGVFKNKGLKEFSRKRYDLLINYYESETLALQLLTAASEAVLKVGISEKFESLNDLIVISSANDAEEFSRELIKYLKILKIID